MDAAMLTCLQIHEDQEAGGVLVFLPGQDDIESLQLLLEENLPYVRSKLSGQGLLKGSVISETTASAAVSTKHTVEGEATVDAEKIVTTTVEYATEGADSSYTVSLLQDFEVMALYAAMPPDEQLKVFSPMRPGVRRFILSTNIAETSVTISGIKYGEKLFCPLLSLLYSCSFHCLSRGYGLREDALHHSADRSGNAQGAACGEVPSEPEGRACGQRVRWQVLPSLHGRYKSIHTAILHLLIVFVSRRNIRQAAASSSSGDSAHKHRTSASTAESAGDPVPGTLPFPVASHGSVHAQGTGAAAHGRGHRQG